ncbi:AAA family ATPase [Paenibacillus sp. MCAF9]
MGEIMGVSLFRLIRFQTNSKLRNNIDVQFIHQDQTYSEEVITTLLIGSNGTGKSYILSKVSEIFRWLNGFKNGINNKKDKNFLKDNDNFTLIYSLGHKVFEIRNESGKVTLNGETLDVKKLKLPNKVLAISYMVNDKFIFQKSDMSQQNDIYEYLGLRDASNVTFVNSAIRKIVDILAELAVDKNFMERFESVLNFLGLNPKITVYFEPKKRVHTFFKEPFPYNEIEDLLNKIKRSSDYRADKIKKWEEEDINQIVNFINIETQFRNVRETKRGSFLCYEIDFKNIQGNNLLKQDFEVLSKLISLNYLRIPKLEISRNGMFDFEEASSGEKHFLFSMIQILSKIEHQSLILIDEPEISLHPNWQIKYINYLRDIVSKYSSCHFLLATHSHFMISDLKPESSSIVSLHQAVESDEIIVKLHDENTFGWSVEDILYNIFGVITTRNLYVAKEVDSFLEKYSLSLVPEEVLKQEIPKLEYINSNLKDTDPLKLVIQKILDRFDENE